MLTFFYATECFKELYPEHCELYDILRERLDLSGISRHFIRTNSHFLSHTYNIGPQAEAKPHRDDKNLICGICAIGVFGRFNHRLAGHLILHEAKLVIELKPGDVIFIPSAAITHSNSPLRFGDIRMSHVQYTAGALFRYKAQGDVTQKNMPPEDLAVLKHLGPQRFREAWSLFPTKAELEEVKRTGKMPERVPNLRERIASGDFTLLMPGMYATGQTH